MGDKVLLNVAATMSRSLANGPGIRAVIWVQGCTIGCAGCYNAFTHPHQQQTLVEPETIADWVASLGDIEGVSFSGGEPFEQSQAVYDAILAIKEINPKLTFFCYSGYDVTELESSNEPSVSNLLSELDMLSAGPYIHAQRSQDSSGVVQKIRNSTIFPGLTQKNRKKSGRSHPPQKSSSSATIISTFQDLKGLGVLFYGHSIV